MFESDRKRASHTLNDSIKFRRKGGGYYYPDLLEDRFALQLIKVEYKPTKDVDNIGKQLNGLAWYQIMD